MTLYYAPWSPGGRRESADFGRFRHDDSTSTPAVVAGRRGGRAGRGRILRCRCVDGAARGTWTARHHTNRLPEQAWQREDPHFEALSGAKAFFGEYDGGVYRVEIPGAWNGELVLSAHGFVTNAGPNGSRLRVGMPAIREHLIAQGFAWAAT